MPGLWQWSFNCPPFSVLTLHTPVSGEGKKSLCCDQHVSYSQSLSEEVLNALACPATHQSVCPQLPSPGLCPARPVFSPALSSYSYPTHPQWPWQAKLKRRPRLGLIFLLQPIGPTMNLSSSDAPEHWRELAAPHLVLDLRPCVCGLSSQPDGNRLRVNTVLHTSLPFPQQYAECAASI